MILINVLHLAVFGRMFTGVVAKQVLDSTVGMTPAEGKIGRTVNCFMGCLRRCLKRCCAVKKATQWLNAENSDKVDVYQEWRKKRKLRKAKAKRKQKESDRVRRVRILKGDAKRKAVSRRINLRRSDSVMWGDEKKNRAGEVSFLGHFKANLVTNKEDRIAALRRRHEDVDALRALMQSDAEKRDSMKLTGGGYNGGRMPSPNHVSPRSGGGSGGSGGGGPKSGSAIEMPVQRFNSVDRQTGLHAVTNPLFANSPREQHLREIARRGEGGEGGGKGGEEGKGNDGDNGSTDGGAGDGEGPSATALAAVMRGKKAVTLGKKYISHKTKTSAATEALEMDVVAVDARSVSGVAYTENPVSRTSLASLGSIDAEIKQDSSSSSSGGGGSAAAKKKSSEKRKPPPPPPRGMRRGIPVMAGQSVQVRGSTSIYEDLRRSTKIYEEPMNNRDGCDKDDLCCTVFSDMHLV